ncbi:asparagine--tRNA ligase [Candidatus Amarolinea dominans]|uniref:asparagine--tRNA ligase n=1 Tax=Candidatus Amarolinea dominans TaxID=3140696 RepID=UPI001E168234|nr:asparagine--tRNA ligase [Anaerolineae bacterium]MBK7201806.1 asparagine--tRNA ligase [Anaerolineae bacterium]MBK9094690.1 asparagine--tRNA ligase [Anaerolineae bacterium]MBK9233965.1 asparagine--tRNA ligase [Anaerolineae bacterium]
MSIVRIENLKDHVGAAVTLRGWLYNKTDKGRLQFLQVRDGSGICQAVVFKKNVSEAVFDAARRLTQESSLIVSGTVRAEERAPGIPGGFELDVTDLEVVQIAADYPISPKEHGVEFLMDNRHLWLRSSRQWAIMRVRATIIKAIRAWLDDHGFMLVDTPILTPAAGEGTTTLFEIDFHGTPAFLAQTGQLYNEANIFAFGPVYCFGPTFRAEKSKTRRHLQEFWMVEPEIPFCKLEELLEIEEQFVSYIVRTVLAERAVELKVLERDISHLQKVTAPFERLHYDEAVAMINAAAAQGVTVPPNDDPLTTIAWGDDFGAPHETYLTMQFEKPVFVHHFPTEVKAFYMEPEPDRPEVCRSADLLAPEGYGEIIGGSERMSDPAKLMAAIEKHKLPADAYDWYIQLRQFGSVPHSGFGLGVERTVAWICGLDHVRETGAFPRMLNRLQP